jgi:hypothetical protein
VFVALDIQHEMRLRHLIIYGLSGSTKFFHTVPLPARVYKKKELLNMKWFFWFTLQLLPETFLILKRGTRLKKKRIQRICGTIRKYLKKTRTDTRKKFYKVAARPTLLYGNETWVTTKPDMTRLEMRFLSVKGYTRLDKIRSEDIRK